MKKTFLLLFIGIQFGSTAYSGDTYVQGYTRKDGTYVQGHHRTTPDNTINNNYTTKGNVNPYTGTEGTVPGNPSQGLGSYNSGNGLGNSNSYGNDSKDN